MSVRFDRLANLIVVGAKLWGPYGSVDARLALDTGATTTLLNDELLSYVGYDPTTVVEHSQVAMGSALDRLPLVTVERLESLEQEMRDLQVLCHTLPEEVGVDGLLGLDFLRDQRLVIDFRRGEITLE